VVQCALGFSRVAQQARVKVVEMGRKRIREAR
jgi:hypothetical protein